MSYPSILTIQGVHAYITQLAAVLDPQSRYVRELMEIVLCADGVADLHDRLRQGCRGRRFSGPAIFDQMTLADQLRACLITNETQIYRFEDGEAEVVREALRAINRIHIASRDDTPIQVLVAPCSHGAEAFTVSSLAYSEGIKVVVDAWDIQPKCIASARCGVVVTGFPGEYLLQEAIVTAEILEPITFEVADLLAWSEGEDDRLWDIVQCRNFLGYFTPSIARRLLVKLMTATRPGGLLVLDPFPAEKFVWLEAMLSGEKFQKRGPAAWKK